MIYFLTFNLLGCLQGNNNNIGISMAENTSPPGGKITDAALNQLVSSPAVAVALFFMWLCGIVLSFIFIENNDNFAKANNQKSYFFNLALGFLPGAIVMITYHAVCHRELLSTLEGLNQSALPASLILAGLSCITVIYKAIKS